MASFGKTLMDFYYAESRTSLSKEDYESAQVWSNAESLVNNFMHGRHPSEWLPILKGALASNGERAESTLEATLYAEAAEYADLLWNEVSN